MPIPRMTDVSKYVFENVTYTLFRDHLHGSPPMRKIAQSQNLFYILGYLSTDERHFNPFFTSPRLRLNDSNKRGQLKNQR